MALRDEKKDLDTLQLLGLKYDDVLPAHELLNLLYERIESTTQVCGYGDVGKGHQRHGPRYRALRCARAHDCVYSEPQAGDVEQQYDHSQHASPLSLAQPAPQAPRQAKPTRRTLLGIRRTG